MNLCVTNHEGNGSFPFELDEKWHALKNGLKARDIEIVDLDGTEPIDALLVFNYSKKAMEKAKEWNVPKERMLCALWEPRTTTPQIHERKYQDSFGVIFSPSKKWIQVEDFRIFNWPTQSFEPAKFIFKDWELRLPQICFVNANKFSFVRGELYSLRREFLTGNFRDSIDVYGDGWNVSAISTCRKLVNALRETFRFKFDLIQVLKSFQKVENYFGVCENKSEVLQKYQIALVIENSEDYISEKLFEAVAAGCLVIYVSSEKLIECDGVPYLGLPPERKVINKAIDEVLQLSPSERRVIAEVQFEAVAKLQKSHHADVVLNQIANDVGDILFTD